MPNKTIKAETKLKPIHLPLELYQGKLEKFFLKNRDIKKESLLSELILIGIKKKETFTLKKIEGKTMQLNIRSEIANKLNAINKKIPGRNSTKINLEIITEGLKYADEIIFKVSK